MIASSPIERLPTSPIRRCPISAEKRAPCDESVVRQVARPTHPADGAQHTLHARIDVRIGAAFFLLDLWPLDRFGLITAGETPSRAPTTTGQARHVVLEKVTLLALALASAARTTVNQCTQWPPSNISSARWRLTQRTSTRASLPAGSPHTPIDETLEGR